MKGGYISGSAIGIGIGYLHATTLSLPGWTVIVLMVAVAILGQLNHTIDRRPL